MLLSIGRTLPGFLKHFSIGSRESEYVNTRPGFAAASLPWDQVGCNICITANKIWSNKMTLTVRLDPALERKFESVCERQRRTKSDVVSALVREFVARYPQKSAYEVAAAMDIIGCVRGGPRDLAQNAKKYVSKAIRAKHSR